MMLQVTQQPDGISLSGRLTARYVHLAFQNPPKFSEAECVIDFNGVEKADSAGLALLVYWMKQARLASCEIVCRNVPANLKEVAELAGVSSIFDGS